MTRQGFIWFGKAVLFRHRRKSSHPLIDTFIDTNQPQQLLITWETRSLNNKKFSFFLRRQNDTSPIKISSSVPGSTTKQTAKKWQICKGQWTFHTFKGVGRPQSSCEIREALNVEPLLLQKERYQLSRLGHVSRMSQEKLARQDLMTTPTRKRSRRHPGTKWSDLIKPSLVPSWRVEPAKLSDISLDREVCRVPLDLLPFPKEQRAQKQMN